MTVPVARPGRGSGGSPLGVVLAAGRGRRFGGAKLLAELDGRPLVVHAVLVLAAASLPVVAVVGPSTDGAEVADLIRSATPAGRIVVNPDPGRGMGSSLAVAARVAGPRPLVVVLGDQPRVPVDDVRSVADALTAGARAVQVVYRDGGRGHPVGFGASLHDRLVDLADEGAGRALLDEVDAITVAVDHDRPRDVDTPADLVDLADPEGDDGRAAP